MSTGSELGQKTRERLAAYLRGLPPVRARDLAEAIEQARDAGDDGLPHQFILETLQPALDVHRHAAERERTAEDLFREPFEDLILGCGPAEERGHIAEASVRAVWCWLCEDLLPQRQGEPIPALIAGDGSGAPSRAAAASFYGICAEALKEALTEAGAREAVVRRLGGTAAFEDARDIAAFLEMAEDALEIRQRFRRPVRALSSGDLNALVLLFDGFAERHPTLVPHFFFVLLGRLEEPWDVVQAMTHVADRVHSGRPDTADRDAVLNRLLSAVETGAQFFRRLNTADFDPVRVADELRAFTRMVNGISRTAAIPAEGIWAQRLMTCRSLVAEKMEIMMERVPRDILAALPVHKIGRFGRVRRRPDVGAPPDTAKADQALRMAKLVEAARPYAADAAFKVAFSEAVADAREGLNEYAESLMDELKRLDAETPAPARAYLDLVITLTALVDGPEAAGRLRRETAAFRTDSIPDTAVS